ncbi:Protein of unknown function [Propionibacterium freudenreichii]|nr:Protein of unknown function [Propionibacterium freudenreichii]CEH01045.1 Protein of unknown function [Propionibacterium freudenreichii]CEH05051.1 Protein of unknown function [Propionibacterium freudenreichii]CEI23961.1 Protein of unknown function [Propionibacterium freudenreichii]
MVVSVQDPANL